MLSTLVAGAVLGWLVGLKFLWSSPQWPRRDKLIATLLLPGGLICGALFAYVGQKWFLPLRRHPSVLLGSLAALVGALTLLGIAYVEQRFVKTHDRSGDRSWEDESGPVGG